MFQSFLPEKETKSLSTGKIYLANTWINIESNENNDLKSSRELQGPREKKIFHR